MGQQQQDGWIEWSGGECPVDASQTIQVQFRCDGREISARQRPQEAGGFRWSHAIPGKHAPSVDIIAYRIVEPSA